MNNIAKYSSASVVNLCLGREDENIRLTIQDNGQGFDPNTAKRGMGLSTMRERAQLSGGDFDLQSAVGRGTLILVSWPS
jgi:signal transduction histidine kinase